MISENMLRKYASLAVRSGANVQKGQILVIRASVDAAPFARLCAREAYAAGASRVQMQWTDQQMERIAYENEVTESMCRVFRWEEQREQELIDHRYAYLGILSETPGLLSHIPAAKLRAVRLARQKAFDKFDYYHMNNQGQWSIVAIPTREWAAKVFPDLPGEEALEKLWESVLSAVRIAAGNDPVKEWKAHGARLEENSARLNAYNLRSLHFQNGLGTDLTVPLVRDHVWVGGGSRTGGGVFFYPNMPSEEIFCMPEKHGAQGVVYASKPLDYHGTVVRDFWFRFENGRVVDYGAREGGGALRNLVEFDEGSRYLGEVALVPYDSPVSKSGVLFFNTLFDENAACHLALGKAYPENLKGGEAMTREELEAHGANNSMEHCDFMFGTDDLRVTGETEEGRAVSIFKEGNFSI